MRPALRRRLLLAALLGVLGLTALAVLSGNVARDLRLLNSANSDNVQWALSQTEVEFLDFETVLASAMGAPAPDLKTLRREFDVFYSRITTLRQAAIYAELRKIPQFARNLRIAQTFLDRAVPVIDADDSTLTAGLPTLQRRADDVRGHIRRLSNSALDHFARESDRRRAAVAVTLSQLAAVVTVLILALLLLALHLGRLNASNVQRRAEAIAAGTRMNIVTDTALDAVIVVDAEGRVLVFNAAAEQIFGYPAEQAIGSALGTLIVPDHHRAAHDAGMAQIRTGGPRNVTGKGRMRLEAKRSNGDVFPVEFAIQSAMTDEGEIFVAFLRDISYRVQEERELIDARDRALAGEKAKTDFLATMSHEIRTPLNGLLGNLTLLSDTPLSPKQARYIRNMDTSGKLLMSHISDVLDITKYDAGKLRLRPADVNLRTLLQDIIDSQSGPAAANGTVLEWEWTGAPVDWIRVDRDRLQHILMNVIGNAVKFTQDGRVTVNLAVRESHADAPVLDISVRDTGIGMDAQLQSQIFDDFTTGDSSYGRNVGGMGEGLRIAQRFAKALDGDISVESAPGEGSTFTISLPIVPVEEPEARPERRKSGAAARPCTILLVEDNEINRFVAREMLTAAGHRVTEAQNGKAAVDLAQNTPFDLILMDISMPIMDGRGATRAIRAGTGPSAQTPIVALTANAMAEEQEAFLSDGMNDVLTKPLTRDGLIRVIADHVQAGSPERTAPAVPGVALSYLDDLRASLGQEALNPLLDRFVAEMDETLKVLTDHADLPFDQIARSAHRVAGSAATVGAVDLRAMLVAAEDAAKEQDRTRVAEAIAALPAIWAATRPFMRAEGRQGAQKWATAG